MKFPTLYIPHGGGPCFFMQWTMGPPDTWDKMADWLRGLGASMGGRPTALLVISAHWEEARIFRDGSAAAVVAVRLLRFPRTHLPTDVSRRGFGGIGNAR